MVDIGTSEKLTNLWPAPPGRSIDKSGSKEKSPQNQHRNKNRKNKNTETEDGPGKNIDEYA